MTDLVTVYDIVEDFESDRAQVIATTWDKAKADTYCATRPNCRVEAVEMPEDMAFQIAE